MPGQKRFNDGDVQYTPDDYANDYLAALQRNPKKAMRERYNEIRTPGICSLRTYTKIINEDEAIIEYRRKQEPQNEVSRPLQSTVGYGRYLYTVGNQRIYDCKHKVHVAFEFDDMTTCPRCTAPQTVERKQKNADDALKVQFDRCNKGLNFNWSIYESFKVSILWSKVCSQLEGNTDCFRLISKLRDFDVFMEQSVNVRFVDIIDEEDMSAEEKAKHIRLRHKLHGGFCPDKVRWRKDQIIACPTDGSIGIVKFSSGDYAGLSSVPISNESVVNIGVHETKQILQGVMGSRAGAAAGHFCLNHAESASDRCRSISAVAQADNLLLPSKGHGTAVLLQYAKTQEGGTTCIKKYNSCYQDVSMTRNSSKQKRLLAMSNGCLREKLMKEMRSRLLFLMLAVHYKLDDATELFRSFGKAIKTILVDNGTNNQQWKIADAELRDFDIVLLEYGCQTGEMRNHRPLAAHCDANRSHLVESMMVFGKVPTNDDRSACQIVEEMQDAVLYLPHEHFALRMRCGIDVLHCKFQKTYHVSDRSRGHSNWSYVHGP